MALGKVAFIPVSLSRALLCGGATDTCWSPEEDFFCRKGQKPWSDVKLAPLGGTWTQFPRALDRYRSDPCYRGVYKLNDWRHPRFAVSYL